MLTIEAFDRATRETRAIRTRVFIEEQAFVTPEEEYDALDATGVHVLVRVDNEPAGTGRMISEGTAGRIGRVAVLPAFRRTEERAAALGLTSLYLEAQCTARGFYEHCGYHAVGDVFDEHGKAHIRMEKELPAAGRE